jgi:hypothetical protein
MAFATCQYQQRLAQVDTEIAKFNAAFAEEPSLLRYLKWWEVKRGALLAALSYYTDIHLKYSLIYIRPLSYPYVGWDLGPNSQVERKGRGLTSDMDMVLGISACMTVHG